MSRCWDVISRKQKKNVCCWHSLISFDVYTVENLVMEIIIGFRSNWIFYVHLLPSDWWWSWWFSEYFNLLCKQTSRKKKYTTIQLEINKIWWIEKVKSWCLCNWNATVSTLSSQFTDKEHRLLYFNWCISNPFSSVRSRIILLIVFVPAISWRYFPYKVTIN